MSRRSRAKTRRKVGVRSPVSPRHTPVLPPSQAVSEEKPSPGPGKVFVTELIDAQSGHAKRYRNVGESPLSLAYHRGQLAGTGDVVSGITAADRHDCGQRFARLWYMRQSTGTNIFERVGGGDGHWWNDHKADASDRVRRIKTGMYGKNFAVIAAYCGEGNSMAASVRMAGIDAHPNGVAPRVREALDDLVTAMTGRK